MNSSGDRTNLVVSLINHTLSCWAAMSVSLRSNFPIVEKKVYLDNAGSGPPPKPVILKMQRFIEEWSTTGEKWPEVLREIVESRSLFATLIGATTREVASMPNVTTATIAVASAIKQKPNANVVISPHNFPTNAYVWQAQRQAGVVKEVRIARPQNGRVAIDEYERMIDDHTSVVAIDYVAWLTGYREKIRQVAELAHEHNAILLTDVFHAAGVFPIDVRKEEIDILTCGMYKWLLGPHGAAYLYVREELLNQLVPTYMGWHSVSESVINRLLAGRELFDKPFALETAVPASDATRFEWGSWSVITLLGSKAALQFALDTKMPEHFNHTFKLRQQIIDELNELSKHVISPSSMDESSGIVAFSEKNSSRVASQLQEEGIVVSGRPGLLRVSPHYYNTSEEVSRFLDSLRDKIG